ncbi:unnamed protein product [Pleuronectes platessa]|uniref:Uncharacterized protein n=1 Tax=Pleuronectes platessa TaxID=8262 RepID=A0A9N7U5P3_PLEPL|nr:unnamed protein product [Pleuronectes platessa]
MESEGRKPALGRPERARSKISPSGCWAQPWRKDVQTPEGSSRKRGGGLGIVQVSGPGFVLGAFSWRITEHVQSEGDPSVDSEPAGGDYISHLAWEHLRISRRRCKA